MQQPEDRTTRAARKGLTLGAGIALLVALFATTLVLLAIWKSRQDQGHETAETEPQIHAPASNDSDTPDEALELDFEEPDPAEFGAAASKELFKTSLQNLPYGEDKLQTLDIYFPTIENAGLAPVMLYVHGGAWRIGDKGQVHSKASAFTERGWIFISVNYRLTPPVQHPEHVRDVAKAIAWTLEHIAESGGDPSQLYLMGHSAGAHLVSLVATDERRLAEWGHALTEIKGVISNDINVYDVESVINAPLFAKTYKAAFGNDLAGWRDASPQRHLAQDKGIPPFLLGRSRGLSFKLDPKRELAAEGFAAALKSVGVEVAIFDGSDRSHGEINKRIGEPDDDFTALIFQTLDRWRATQD